MKDTGNKASSTLKKQIETLQNPGMDAIQNRHQKKPPKPKRQHRTPKNDRESAVLSECIRFLVQRKSVAYVERRNTGAAKYVGGYFVRFGSPGAADIWCLIGKPLYAMDLDTCESEVVGSMFTHVEIECKNRTGKGRLSAEQKTFKRMCDDAGIPYFMVTSAEDLAEQLQGAGLLAV